MAGRTLLKQGKPITASLEHLVFYPDKASHIYPTIVALHGRGTDSADLLPLIESLELDDVLVVAPHAPLPFNPWSGFAWYDLSQQWVPNPRTFNTSLQLLRRFLAESKGGYPLDPQRLILLGFSQGAVMAYAAGLLEPSSIRGIVALSGYIPHRSGLPLQLHNLNGLAAFVAHGTHDEIIPVQLGRESAELLKKAGADLLYREYPMGHEVREETVRDLGAWMRKLLL